MDMFHIAACVPSFPSRFSCGTSMPYVEVICTLQVRHEAIDHLPLSPGMYLFVLGRDPFGLLLCCVSLRGDTLLAGASVTRLSWLFLFFCGFPVIPMVTNPLFELAR